MDGYGALLERLFGLRRFGMELGLDRMRRVLTRLGEPQRRAPILHIAGTNGKGSTAAFAESILRAAGLRTALYTSPHLSRFSERFRIAGVEATADALVTAATRVDAAATGETLTFFELATAMAFQLFADAAVDVAVLEVGLGGRLDATNAADGDVAVVTGIALDHTAELGPTLGAIAREKAGIFRTGRAAIVALPDAEPERSEVRDAFEAVAREHDTRLVVRGEDFHLVDRVLAGDLVYRGTVGPTVEIKALSLAGAHQRSNAALALAGVLELAHQRGLAIPIAACAQGLETARWPGRLERIASEPETWVDAAHNPDGARALHAALREHVNRSEPRASIVLVLGVLADKDADGIVRALAPLARRIYVTAPPSPRALPAAALAELAGRHAGRLAVTTCETAIEAIDRARRSAGPHEVVVVAGSIFLVAAAREHLLGEPRDPLPVAESLTR